jgi:hypothetical protein
VSPVSRRIAAVLIASMVSILLTGVAARAAQPTRQSVATGAADSLRLAAPTRAEGTTPITGAYYERRLTVKSFRFRRNGNRYGGTADVHVDYSVKPNALAGVTPQSGRLKEGGGDYSPVHKSRRPKKCKDTGCDSGGHDSDCWWFDANGQIFDDWAVTPAGFCNPLKVDLTFYNDHAVFNARKIGTCVSNGSSISHLTSPAPPASGSQTTCDPRSIENTLHGKPAYVEFQWEMLKDNNGTIVGYNSCNTDSAFCGIVQQYQFGQPNGCQVRCNMTLNDLDLNDQAAHTNREAYFMFDTDSNILTGDPDAVNGMCGAEFRIHITFVYPGGGPPTVTAYREQFISGAWTILAGGGPIDLVISPASPSRSIDFKMLLSDLGSPSTAIVSWCVFTHDNILSSQPCEPCQQLNRVPVFLQPSNNCPTVLDVDDSATHISGFGAVVVTFSAPMQTIAVSDVSISPSLPVGYAIHVSQSNANEKLNITVTPNWPPGHWQLTLQPTIKDCSGVAIGDPSVPGICGIPVVRDFCTEESHLRICNSSSVTMTGVAFGLPVYATGSGFTPSTSYQVWLVQQDEFDRPNEPLVDYSNNGPNAVVTDASGNLPLTLLGIPVAIDRYNVVVDTNGDGTIDDGDRVAVVCSSGLEVGPPCNDSDVEPPMALWSMDQKTGTLAGERTEGLDGTLTGTTAWITGRVDGALDLQSTALSPAYVTVANDPDLAFLLDDFSISVWIRTSSPSGTILSHLDGTGMGYVLSLTGGVPQFTLNDGSGTSTYTAASTTPHLDNGSWHLVTVAVERSSTTGLTIWSDLTQVLTGNPTARSAAILPAASLIIGNTNPPAGSAIFTGALDEVSLFDVALTYAAIHEIYAAPATGGCVDTIPVSHLYPNPSCLDTLAISWITRTLAYPFAGSCMPFAAVNAPGDTLLGVGGIVTAIDGLPTTFGFYLQSTGGGPWSGIKVFTGGTNVAGLATGDSVKVEFGALENFQGGMELTSPNNSVGSPNIVLRKVNSGNPLPAFHVATPADANLVFADTAHAQQWQGTLVRVNGPLRVARSGAPLPANVFYAVDVSHPSDSVYVDGRTLTTVATPSTGTIIDWVQGVLDHFLAGTVLQLRGAGDIAAAAPPSLTDAYPISDSQVRVVFDRAVTTASGTNTNNYSLSSFGSVNAAAMDGTSAVLLTIANGLSHGDPESVTANGLTSLASGLSMTTPQTRSFVNGVLSVQEMSAPNADSLLATPCFDKSRFAGGGGRINQGDPGPRTSFAGVCTGQFGNLYYFEDASPSGAGNHGGATVSAPPSPLTVGRSYLLAGAVTMSFGETQFTSVQYLSDRGAVPVPAPAHLTVTLASNAACNTSPAAADYRSMLVTLSYVRVVAGTPPPDGFTVEGEYPGYGHTIFVQNLANALGPYSSYNSLYPAPGQVIDVTGELHLESGSYRVCPRNASDVVLHGANVGAGNTPLSFTFRVGPNPAFARPGNPVQISFTIPTASRVELGVFDVTGRRVATLVPSGMLPAGQYTNIHWSGRDDSGSSIQAGVYFYQLRVDDKIHVLRTIVLGSH